MNYSILVNQDIVGPISLARGLRQGDHLSPYLFIICAEGLSTLIKVAKRRGEHHGTRISRGALSISHLLFADDCFLFHRASLRECTVMKKILSKYEAASGQAINLSKSELFF